MCSIVELTDKFEKTVNYVMFIKLYCDKIEKQKNDMIPDEDILKYLYLTTENIYSISWEITKFKRKSMYNEKPKDILKFFIESYNLSDKCIEKIKYIDLFYRSFLKNGIESRFFNNKTLRKLTEYYEDILDELNEYLEY